MKYACAQLADGGAAAEAGPQIPDAAMQKLYAKALAELAKGAVNCRTAIPSKPDGDESDETYIDATTLRLATSELAAAGAEDISVPQRRSRSSAVSVIERQAMARRRHGLYGQLPELSAVGSPPVSVGCSRRGARSSSRGGGWRGQRAASPEQ